MKRTSEQRRELTLRVRQYFRDEFEFELGDLRAEFVLEFFDQLIGPDHYNEALAAARASIADRSETLLEDLLALVRETDPRKR